MAIKWDLFLVFSKLTQSEILSYCSEKQLLTSWDVSKT